MRRQNLSQGSGTSEIPDAYLRGLAFGDFHPWL